MERSDISEEAFRHRRARRAWPRSIGESVAHVVVCIRAGRRDGVTTEAAAEIRALKRRNAELKQSIEILKAATSFFVRESDPHNRR